MPAEIVVEGAEKLYKLGAQLKEIGDKELRRDLFAGVRRATVPITEAAKASARAVLPKRGGLNEVVASSKFGTRTRVTGNSVGVRIVAEKKKDGGKKSDLEAIDRGTLRHPVYGHRKTWVLQNITPGWFSKPAQGAAPMVRLQVVAVLDDVARRIERG